MRTSPIDFGLLGGNGNTLNKDDSKIKSQKNIDRHDPLRYLCRTMPPFPSPRHSSTTLGSHYRPPLKPSSVLEIFNAARVHESKHSESERLNGEKIYIHVILYFTFTLSELKMSRKSVENLTQEMGKLGGTRFDCFFNIFCRNPFKIC